MGKAEGWTFWKVGFAFWGRSQREPPRVLLEKNPKATEEEIRFGLEGNICRCTGYVKIVDSVKKAQKAINKKKK